MDAARSLSSQVARFIDRHDLLPDGCTVIVGVSGGPDSMCLLEILWRMAGTHGWHIVAAHVNHLLRAEESDGDEAFVHDHCANNGIPFHCRRIDVRRLSKDSGDSLETAARNVRYRFFQDLVNEEQVSILSNNGSTVIRIAVAHHREDQAETLLMHLFRGSGIDGLSGMAPLSGRIARPLLELSRAEILDYLSDVHLTFRLDSTNLCFEAARNRIRLEMIPLAASIFGQDPCARLAGTAALLREDALYLDAAAYKTLVDLRDGDSIDALVLGMLPEAIAGRIVRIMYAETRGSRINLGRDHVAAVLKLASNDNDRASISLPGRIMALRDVGFIRFMGAGVKTPDREWAPIPLSLAGWTETPAGRFCAAGSAEDVRDAGGSGLQYTAFRLSALSGAVIRTRRAGDRIRPVNGSGSRSLKRYLIDRHVPVESRGRLPVVAVGDTVAWIPGIAVSSGFAWVTGRDPILDCIWLAYCP